MLYFLNNLFLNKKHLSHPILLHRLRRLPVPSL